MPAADDIARIAEQERRLVFDRFDEATAFAIGSLIRERGLADKMPIVVELRLWDRLLFYAALPSSTASNGDWVRRKLNVVKMFQKSTYRMVLEEQRPDRTFKPGVGLSATEYVLAGGGFPITVNGIGVVGGIGVSGLPERQDHAVVVAALSAILGLNEASLALGDEA
ncbi:MAG TPA: heme-degrading domain-containing protein [Mesorhizobium sp.]|jgi:uncharacterized protein (UPF0303 family)